MAIYHCSAKIIGRSSGRSAVGSSAYRSGEKLYNHHDGVSHDYTNKKDVVHSEIMLCENAPTEYSDRQKLWNAVEQIEKGSRAQLSREIEIALPIELNLEEQKALVKNYVNDNFVKAGMCADVNIHDNGKGNPHAHIMLTMRAIDEQGKFMPKSKKIYMLDEKGEKIYNKNTQQYKCYKENTTDWNDKEKLEEWRKDLADKINVALEKKYILEIIDHRSFERQGIEKIPTIHLGSSAHQQEQKGVETERGNHNRQVLKYNNQLEKIESQIKDGQSEIDKLKNEKPKEITAEQYAKNLYNKQNSAIKNIIEIRKIYKQKGLFELHKREIPKTIKELKSDFSILANWHRDMQKNVKEYERLKATHKPIINNNKPKMESLNDEIKHQKNVISQMSDNFKNNFKTEPTRKGFNLKLEELEREIKKAEKDLEQYPSNDILTAKENEIILYYKIDVVRAELQADGPNIKAEFNKLNQSAEPKPSFETIKIKQDLNFITNQDRKEIAKKIADKQPDQAKKLIEQVKEQEQKQSRGQSHER